LRIWLTFYHQSLVEKFPADFDLKIFIAITIRIENPIVINRTLLEIFSSFFDFEISTGL